MSNVSTNYDLHVWQNYTSTALDAVLQCIFSTFPRKYVNNSPFSFTYGNQSYLAWSAKAPDGNFVINIQDRSNYRQRSQRDKLGICITHSGVALSIFYHGKKQLGGLDTFLQEHHEWREILNALANHSHD